MEKITIIGGGNMGGAIAKSLCNTSYDLTVTAATNATLERLSGEICGIKTSLDNRQACENADLVIIAVKPWLAKGIADQIRDTLKPGCTVVSVVAGLKLEDVRNMFCVECKKIHVIRCIPNTAIRNCRSVTFLSYECGIPDNVKKDTEAIFSLSGKVFVIPEMQMGACCAITSCGIAYFLRFIRAISEGGVECGLKPGFATEIAALTAEGVASLLSNGEHPEAEIDKVTTPGGITIRGLNTLEKYGFTNAVIESIKASIL